jgi:DNA-binding NtrC family response regulator
MHACWLLLAAAGEIPAIVLQIRERRFVSRTLPLITEINPRSRAMPQILPNLAMQEIPETSPAEMKQALADSGIVGEHPALQTALQTAARAARYDLPVLLLGESGTGKELFARFIHRISRRRERSFLAVNCGSLPETLIESELFGHTKGSFTGAVANKKGHFELAEGGTLFLDEIGDAPILMQVKLLRALETQEITPLGGAKPLRTDVRIVAATNRDLQSLIAAGRFREDLYHRLAAIRIALPQLNERRSDIPLIALCQLHRFNVEWGTRKQLTQRALQSLQRHDWRGGNIRALRNVVHSSAVMSDADAIDSADLMLPRTGAECEGTVGIEIGEGFSLDDYLNGVRRQCYRQALEQAGGNRSEAARRLGVSAQAVHNFLKENPDLLSKLNCRQ